MVAVEDEGQDSRKVPFWVRFRWLRSIIVVIIYIATGVIFVKWQEGWDILTAMYVITEIITTIGYGDVHVKKDVSQWFMIFYVFAGVLITANIVNDWIDRQLRLANEAMRARLRRLEAHLLKTGRDIKAIQTGEPSLSTHLLQSEMTDRDQMVRERYGALNGMLVAGLVYFCFLIGGAVFYHLWESCTCSYGSTHAAGCVPGDQCFSTGGYRKDFQEALYMAVITLSTVGFGDLAPKTKVGRIFALFWMPLGVLSWVIFVTNVTFWWRAKQKVEKSHTLLLEELQELDADGNGRITRAEFRVFFLLKEEIVKSQDIRHIDSFFASLDKEGRGYVTEEQIRRNVSSKCVKF